ncbi:MAG: DUF4388 domain-containing protein, partial [Deltaproteobacteria bacterium]
HGTLKAYPLLDLFQRIALDRLTGILSLDEHSKHFEFLFEGGELVQVTSEFMLHLNLVSVLFRHGFITEEAFEIAKNRIRYNPNWIGKFLLEKGMITEERLEEGLKRQAEEKLIAAFALAEAAFSFTPDAIATNRQSKRNFQEALFKAIEQQVKPARLRRQVKDHERHGMIVVLDDTFDMASFPFLKASELRFLQGITHETPLSDLLSRAQIPRVRTYQILAFLRALGKIDFAREPRRRAKPHTNEERAALRRQARMIEKYRKKVMGSTPRPGSLRKPPPSPEEGAESLEELQQIMRSQQTVVDYTIGGARPSKPIAANEAELRALIQAGMNLEDANLKGINLAGADLSGMHLAGVNFEKANLRKVNFTGANLMRANF